MIWPAALRGWYADGQTIMIRQPPQAAKQRGAVAIEFAVLFMVFFAFVYAIIAYSIPLLLTLSFKQISADAARDAVRVSPATQNYLERVSQQVYETVDSSWLPPDWRQDGCPAPNSDWKPLPAYEEMSYGHYRMETAPTRYHLNICLQRKYDKDNAIIPVLTLFNVNIPSLPKDEDGSSYLRGRSTIRL